MKEKRPITLKDKGIYSIVAVIAAVLWILLWYIFPMPFYSIFFASVIGSNIMLILLSVIITVIFNYIFSKATSRDISIVISVLMNIIFSLGFIYTYSIFRYTAVYIVAVVVAAHCMGNGILFAKSRKYPETDEKNEKSTVSLIVSGVICTLLCDSSYLLLFTLLLSIFRE